MELVEFACQNRVMVASPGVMQNLLNCLILIQVDGQLIMFLIQTYTYTYTYMFHLLFV